MSEESDNPSDAKPAPVDLAFATDDELINELGKRFEGAIFVSEKSSRNSDDTLTYRRWFGSLSLCIGLADRMLRRLERKAEGNERDSGDDE